MRLDDLQGRPTLGTLMFMPYLRILPMHIGIILSGTLGGGGLMLVLFVLLKTTADLGLDHADRRVAVKHAAQQVAPKPWNRRRASGVRASSALAPFRADLRVSRPASAPIGNRATQPYAAGLR